MKSVDSFRTTKTIRVGTQTFSIYSLSSLEKSMGIQLSRLPISLRILLENLLRREDGTIVQKKDIESLARWNLKATLDKEIAFMPARVLLQDFTGVPCIVDLASMRDAMIKMGGDPNKINPSQPVDLVIDHSVQVDEFGTPEAFRNNAAIELERNRERYAFLRWGQQAFQNFRVVPPDTGIVHQINLEYLAQVVFSSQSNGETFAYPDTLVGTDSHTTMINGLGVLGWGVGGIEAEAAMLGQPISMLIPQVVGFKLHGKLNPGTTATDLVLTITQLLRKKGVVSKFVEFFGQGLSSLSLADRATIANMAPEYGATMGFFPVDIETINYLRFTGRSEEQVALTETYLKEQGLFHSEDTPEPEFSIVIDLDLATIEPSIAGPKRPQDRIPLSKSKSSFRSSLVEILESKGAAIDKMAAANWAYYSDDSIKPDFLKSVPIDINGSQHNLQHGSVAIAAITSCTNTSNPSVLITAGLLAKKACEKGLKTKSWVKTSLAPGSKVVTEYLRDANLMEPLESLGFHLVGYGCTTCIGNSGPLIDTVGKAIQENDLVAAAVLSGNRNFEGRVNPYTQINYLASPPLVVAYALIGSMDIDFAKESIGIGKDGEPVFLKDIWPTPQEVEQTMRQSVKSEMFKKEYANVFEGDENWKNLSAPTGTQYAWDESSTYIKAAPYFENLTSEQKPLEDIHNAHVLVLLDNSVTTDHISPAGSFTENTPAGSYLMSLGVQKNDFNSYGARRGNHEIMMRGTFANIRLKNLLLPGIEGGVTLHPSSQNPISIFDAAMKYKEDGTPLIIIAGKEYGSGSSRDWAAKGPALLGVRAVIAESFERIHRSNLIGMGVLPLQFQEGQNYQTLGLSGLEVFDIEGIADGLQPRKKITVTAISQNGLRKSFTVICRIDTPNEVDYYKHNGILQYVLRTLLKPEQPEIEEQVNPAVEVKTKKYRILFKGEIDDGQELRAVKERMAKLFKASPAQIERLFAGKPVTINNNLDHAAAQEYITEMKKAGALCYFEPMPESTPSQTNGNAKILPTTTQVNTGSPSPSHPAFSKVSNISKTAASLSVHSKKYFAGQLLTTAGMILLFSLYFYLILFIATTTFDHAVDNIDLVDTFGLIFGLLAYLPLLIVGIILVASMLKPLFAHPMLKKFSIPLSRKKEPALFDFVERIYHSLGSKIPANIEVDCTPNVSASYRRGLISFLEDDITFYIGLPVISKMTTNELTSVLAHECGHFIDKTSMGIHYIITSVNAWFERAIFEEDEVDHKIDVLLRTSDNLSRLLLSIAKLFIWLTRKIITVFMLVGHWASKSYVRQMVFDADRHAVRLAGYEAFESSIRKLNMLNAASEEALSQLKTQRKPDDNSLPDNFSLLVSSIAQRMSEDIVKNKKETLSAKSKPFNIYPTDPERIKNLKSASTKTSPIDNNSASILLGNFDETAKLASVRFYRDVLGLRFTKESLVPTADYEYTSAQTDEQTPATTTTDTENPFF